MPGWDKFYDSFVRSLTPEEVDYLLRYLEQMDDKKKEREEYPLFYWKKTCKSIREEK